jgi:hypothetical protein
MSAQPTRARQPGEPLSIVQECWIAKRLRKPDLFCGLVTPAARVGAWRAHLLAQRLGGAIVGHRGPHADEVWREFFERITGEPLGGEITD